MTDRVKLSALQIAWARKLKESGFDDIENLGGGPFLERHHMDTNTRARRGQVTLEAELFSRLTELSQHAQYATMRVRMALLAYAEGGMWANAIEARLGGNVSRDLNALKKLVQEETPDEDA